MSLLAFQDRRDEHDGLSRRIEVFIEAVLDNDPSLDRFKRILRMAHQDVDAVFTNNHTYYSQLIGLEQMSLGRFMQLMRDLQTDFFRVTHGRSCHMIWTRGLTDAADNPLAGHTHLDRYNNVIIELDPEDEKHGTARGIMETFLHELAHAIPVRYCYDCPCQQPSCRRVWRNLMAHEGSGHALYWQTIAAALEYIAMEVLNVYIDLGRIESFVNEWEASGVMPSEDCRYQMFSGWHAWQLHLAIIASKLSKKLILSA